MRLATVLTSQHHADRCLGCYYSKRPSVSSTFVSSMATYCSIHRSHGRDLEHLNLRRLHSVQHSVARRREIDMAWFPRNCTATKEANQVADTSSKCLDGSGCSLFKLPHLPCRLPTCPPLSPYLSAETPLKTRVHIPSISIQETLSGNHINHHSSVLLSLSQRSMHELLSAICESEPSVYLTNKPRVHDCIR
jgi:hypothetical protein